MSRGVSAFAGGAVPGPIYHRARGCRTMVRAGRALGRPVCRKPTKMSSNEVKRYPEPAGNGEGLPIVERRRWTHIRLRRVYSKAPVACQHINVEASSKCPSLGDGHEASDIQKTFKCACWTARLPRSLANYRNCATIETFRKRYIALFSCCTKSHNPQTQNINYSAC